MREIETFIKIKDLEDRLTDIYFNLKFNDSYNRMNYINELKQIRLELSLFSEDIATKNPDITELIVLNDLTIGLGEKKEILTNITGRRYKEEQYCCNLNGYIPSHGYLKVVIERDEQNKVKIYAQNLATKDFNYNESIDFSKSYIPGVYEINQGSRIGEVIYIQHEKQVAWLEKYLEQNKTDVVADDSWVDEVIENMDDKVLHVSSTIFTEEDKKELAKAMWS